MEKEKNSPQEKMLMSVQHSKNLVECLIRLNNNDTNFEAKNTLMDISSHLCPNGMPDFKNVIKYPKISKLVFENGKSKIRMLLFVLINDFCRSLNVVRNMNEGQMIECASMLLEDCGNNRLEDYVMFFNGAKKGRYGRILDHIDIQVISEMFNEYENERWMAGKKLQEEPVNHFDSLGNTQRTRDKMNTQNVKIMDSMIGLSSALGEMNKEFKNKFDK